MNQEVIGYTRKLLGFPRNLLVFAMIRAYKVVRIYAKSPYTDHPGKFHKKMVRKTPKKSLKSLYFLISCVNLDLVGNTGLLIILRKCKDQPRDGLNNNLRNLIA